MTIDKLRDGLKKVVTLFNFKGDFEMDIEQILKAADFSKETDFVEVLRMRLIKNFFMQDAEEDEIDDYDVEDVIAAKSAEYFGKINNPSI